MKSKEEALRIINKKKGDYRIFVLCFVFFIGFLTGRLSAQDKAEIDAYAFDVAIFFDIPTELLPAIIRVESDYVVNAKSEKGAHGLMQVTEPAFNDYLKKNNTYISNYEIVKTNWKANIAVGSWYLKEVCYSNKGNWHDAILAYFWGPWNRKTTLTYLNKVKGQM